MVPVHTHTTFHSFSLIMSIGDGIPFLFFLRFHSDCRSVSSSSLLPTGMLTQRLRRGALFPHTRFSELLSLRESTLRTRQKERQGKRIHRRIGHCIALLQPRSLSSTFAFSRPLHLRSGCFVLRKLCCWERRGKIKKAVLTIPPCENAHHIASLGLDLLVRRARN